MSVIALDDDHWKATLMGKLSVVWRFKTGTRPRGRRWWLCSHVEAVVGLLVILPFATMHYYYPNSPWEPAIIQYTVHSTQYTVHSTQLLSALVFLLRCIEHFLSCGVIFLHLSICRALH